MIALPIRHGVSFKPVFARWLHIDTVGFPTFYVFNTHSCPAAAGGAAIAYRAGAKLVNIDVPYRHAGVKGFARSGKAINIFLL